jgi:L-2,4-diaminobutyric acid acetyltransferase
MQMSDGKHFEMQQRPRAEPQIRVPQPGDGPRIWRLIKAAGALDTNSLYCNLLQCSHFAETCAVAEFYSAVDTQFPEALQQSGWGNNL